MFEFLYFRNNYKILRILDIVKIKDFKFRFFYLDDCLKIDYRVKSDVFKDVYYSILLLNFEKEGKLYFGKKGILYLFIFFEKYCINGIWLRFYY